MCFHIQKTLKLKNQFVILFQKLIHTIMKKSYKTIAKAIKAIFSNLRMNEMPFLDSYENKNDDFENLIFLKNKVLIGSGDSFLKSKIFVF